MAGRGRGDGARAIARKFSMTRIPYPYRYPAAPTFRRMAKRLSSFPSPPFDHKLFSELFERLNSNGLRENIRAYVSPGCVTVFSLYIRNEIERCVCVSVRKLCAIIHESAVR